MPATSLLPFDLNEVFDPEASSEEENEEPQLKKRKLNNFFINLDKDLLINIFCYSSIIDIFKSFQFINKEFNFIFKSEEFKKIYYGNVFKLNSEEINNLNNLLNELQNIIAKEREEENKKKNKKNKKNKNNKNENIVKEVIKEALDVTKIDFAKVPFNFEHLFNYYCKLQFNSYSIYGNYLNEQISNNFKNKDFKNYKENLQKINNLIDPETAKIYLFQHFNRNNNTKNGNLCYKKEEADQEENEIEYISSDSDSEVEFTNELKKKNPLQNKMNRIFNLFKLSKFSYNHIYPIIYNFEEEDEDESIIKFILFLDNGIPLFISTQFKADTSEYILKMEVYNKLLFYFENGESKSDLTFITDLIDKIFILNKEELFELINEEKSNELDEKNRLKENSFIVGYLFYLLRVFHEDGIDSSPFADALEAFNEGYNVKVILYEENGEIIPNYKNHHCRNC
ncbi:hypothetical protein ABK040_013144 [Willaertia magna]